MEEKIRANIKKFREELGRSQKALGKMIGKSESAIQGYESGKTDIPLSALVLIAEAFGVTVGELADGKQKPQPTKQPVELRIYIQEERLNVASVLIKNGYKVFQGKRNKTPTGKALDYFLVIEENADAVDTSR